MKKNGRENDGRRYYPLIFTFIILLINIPRSWGKLLSDYQPYEFEVLFTNPDCADYFYPQPIKSQNGSTLYKKPSDTYCTAEDFKRSAERVNSPQQKMIEWIKDPNTTEIYMAFFSFSNKDVFHHLCQAVKERNVKITFVIDKKTDHQQVKNLSKCRFQGDSVAGTPSYIPRILYRGGGGMNSEIVKIGLHHNKIIIINPNSSVERRYIFGSGNLSSGTTLHHENWNFLTTSPQTFFAQIHQCLIKVMEEHFAEATIYKKFIEDCRKSILAEEEEDMKVYLIPGEEHLIKKDLLPIIKQADQVDLAIHHFTYKFFIQQFEQKLKDQTLKMQVIADDDLYWVGKVGENLTSNFPVDVERINSLTSAGALLKYMETNNKAQLLHHNKFFITTQNETPSAVFTGAGNFTGAAFRHNFENFYLIKTPSITSTYKKQFDHLWSTLSTAPEMMPVEFNMPQKSSASSD